MKQIDTDYLVIGAGAVGLAFADTLLDETEAHITLVDRHGQPGGHWNDAYPFVALHQPSAFYGVNSQPLGDMRKDSTGLNQGFYELASGAEVSSYFRQLMQQRLLASGRVSYYPMSNYLGEGRFESVLSGAQTQVRVRRKTVDATYYGTTVPATHTPRFQIEPGVRLLPPNALPELWQGKAARPAHYCIVGAGKTGMDVGVWLLGCGVEPSQISWIMPRDSWLLNRRQTQPGMEFFEDSIGGQASQMEACAAATSIEDLYLRLEACGTLLRIDRARWPTMFHYATMSEGEVEQLRRIGDVVRMGRVQALDAKGVQLEQGQRPMPADTLYIDCTASAVERRPLVPIFQGDRIVLQIVRAPAPCFSAAFVAHIEAHYTDEAQQNRLCTPVPFPNSLAGFPRATMGNMLNQFLWSQDKSLRQWIRNSRLDGFGRLSSEVDPQDTARQAILLRFKNSIGPAMANIPKLLEQPQGTVLA